jgi:hypothetical protein
MGIEPTSEAWEASILPLYDARLSIAHRLYTTKRVHVQFAASPTRMYLLFCFRRGGSFPLPSDYPYFFTTNVTWDVNQVVQRA